MMFMNTIYEGFPRHVATASIETTDPQQLKLVLSNINHAHFFPAEHIHGTIVHFRDYFHFELPFGEGVMFKGVFNNGEVSLCDIHHRITEGLDVTQFVNEIKRYRAEYPDFFK